MLGVLALMGRGVLGLLGGVPARMEDLQGGEPLTLLRLLLGMEGLVEGVEVHAGASPAGVQLRVQFDRGLGPERLDIGRN